MGKLSAAKPPSRKTPKKENSDTIVESLEKLLLQPNKEKKRKEGDTIDESISKKKKKKRKKSRKLSTTLDDHITNLPEPVMHHILSLLPSPKDAARTSILSKRWRHIWVSYSGLEYDEHKFRKQCRRNKVKGCKKAMFRDFVNQSIERSFKDNSGIQKFMLNISPYNQEIASDMDSWIDIAVQNQINELDLRVPVQNKMNYILSKPALASDTITTLRLRGCDCHWEDMKLTNLKRVYFRQLHVLEENIKKLVVSCPKIEDLRLISCRGLECLRFSSLELQTVEVYQCEELTKIELEAPNLHKFWYAGKKSKSTPCVLNFEGCTSLKVVTLEDPWMTDALFQYHLSNLPLLEKLSLTKCELLENIDIFITHLERLTLRDCKNLLKVDFDAPNLRSFEYKGHRVPFTSLHPFVLEEAKIFFQQIPRDSQARRDFIQLMSNFLKKFNPHEGFKLIVSHKKDVIIYEHWEEIRLPYYEDCSIEIVRSSANLVELFENVLRTRHPRFVNIVSRHRSKLYKVISDMIWKERPVCCKYKTKRCWRCQLCGAREMKIVRGNLPWINQYVSGQKIIAIRLFWSNS